MTLKGIDISGWQANVNLAAVPCDFVIIKATGGSAFVNQSCDRQFQQGLQLKKRLGLYHFAHEAGYQSSAIVEANHFVDSIKGYLPFHPMLILDFEGDNQFDVVWAKAWLDHVKTRTGVKPLIYMNGAVYNGANWASVWNADYGLWFAQYAVSSPTQGYNFFNGVPIDQIAPQVPCAMWQFSSTARLPGWDGQLDVNVFYGDAAAWDAYCRPSGVAVPAPVKAPIPVKAPVKPPVKAPAKPAPVRQCTVEAGDTLSGIGVQFGVSWTAIAALNNISAPYTIHPGQVLNLPIGKPSAPAPTPPRKVRQCTVEAGDTLSGIGAQFGVNWQAIATLNHISAPYTIHPGQVLNLP